MQRELFEERLNELLDLRASLEDDEQLGDEALLDVEQREVIRGLRLMLDGLAACEVPSLSDDFAARVVAEARAEQAVETKRSADSPRILPLVLFAACAALLLVAAVGLWSWLNSPADTIEIAAPTPPPAVPAANSPVDGVQTPDAEIAVAQDGEIAPTPHDDPILVTPQQSASEEQVASRYRQMYRIFAELRQQPGGIVEQDLLAMRPQWVDEMALGLKPVATSIGGAINVLRLNLPPSEKNIPAEDPQTRNYADAGTQLA